MTILWRMLGSLFLAWVIGASASTASIASAASAASGEVTVETLEGITRGQLQEINDQKVILSMPRGKVAIPWEQLIELRWERPTWKRLTRARPKESITNSQGEVVFADGSVVPYAEWKISDAGLRLLLPDSSGGVVTAPLTSVRSWRLPGALTAASKDQWQSVCEQNAATDMLVLRRRDSESIDSVEGIIQSCDAQAVRFEYEGESIEVPWSRVYGLVFFNQQAIEPMIASTIVHGPDGLLLKATHLEADAQLLRLSYNGRQAELPLAVVQRIDMSAGKTQRLSEATVIESEWTPYFQPATIGGPPQRNAAFDGGPLRLRFPDSRADGVWRIQAFDDGWALRSESQVVLKLEPWARQLRGWIGIDPATAATGSAEVTLWADDVRLLTLQVDGNTEPVELSLPVEGVRELTLRVDYGENLDTGDNVHFVDLRVTR